MTQWKPGMDSINSKIVNDFDFWLSVGIGIQIAIAFIGIFIVVTSSIEAARGIKNRNRGSWTDIPKGRGDNVHTVKIALGLWLLATIGYVWFTHALLPTFPHLAPALVRRCVDTLQLVRLRPHVRPDKSRCHVPLSRQTDHYEERLHEY